MSIKTDAFREAVKEALKSEHNFISGINEAGLFSIPKTILQYICGKAVYNKRNEIFEDEKAEWIWRKEYTSTSKFLIFRYNASSKDNHFLYADIIPVNLDEDLLLQLQSLLQNFGPHKKLVATILQCTQKQAEVWVQIWEEKIGSILKPLGKPTAISHYADNTQIWLITWEDALPAETADVHINAGVAMGDAIRNMYFESMMQMIKRIISLRTNLEENSLQAQTNITQIFKMVFAKEQGVSLEDVYDPEAMAGLTDSQLAAGNFISDMQKAFNIDFSDEEIFNINTLNDLVSAIIHKKAS